MPLQHSLLWKISGKHLTKPSYLFGTMHMMCEADFVIKKKVLSALRKCKQIVMEVNLADVLEMETMHQPTVPSKSLSEGFTEEERQKFNELLQSECNLTLEEAEYYSPAHLINQMILKAVPCDSIKIFEIEFVQIAASLGMETAGLETAQEQVDIAETVFDPKELLRQLKSGNQYAEVFQKMRDAYAREDLGALDLLINDPRFMNIDGEEKLLLRRNSRWLQKMPALMEKQPVFFAVGAGHLGQSHGLISGLRNHGFSVNPVYR